MPSSSTSRDKSPLAVLLNPKDNIPRGEKEIRLEDYLNDKIQTDADFGNLESLIANIDLQKEQLQKQLQDARSKLQEARQSSANHTSSMLEQTEEFKRQRDNVQKRLMTVTNSDTTEEATRQFKGPMEKAQRLELARADAELLKDVDGLRNDARLYLPSQPKEALKPYIQLKELSLALVDLQLPAEGAAPHLVRHVQNATTKLWADMKKIMTNEFEAILRGENWPAHYPSSKSENRPFHLERSILRLSHTNSEQKLPENGAIALRNY